MVFALPAPLPFVLPGANDNGGGANYPGHLRPLARFMPPPPLSAATAWLQLANPAPAGAWLIDPFGTSPALPVAAARLGWRILVSANNPIQRFLLELAVHPPTAADLRLALSDLAASRKGSERLELHLRSLYLSKCRACGAEVEVQAYLWERGPNAETIRDARLYARIYQCKLCGESGEFPAEPADVEAAGKYASGGLHYARALERVVSANDPDRQHAVEALETYLPRAVYFLFTLINKFDGLNLPTQRRSHLAALLLHACDQGSSLSGHPAEREHPRSLAIPTRFKENNLWLALEEAIAIFSQNAGKENPNIPVPLTVYPVLPPESGGICIFEGALREFQNQSGIKPAQFQAALCMLPRPNQAFWTLSALWAGWLWGQEAAAVFKSVLRRRRYDWAWHTSALQAAFENLARVLPLATPFLGLSEENEPGLFGAAISAARTKGFQLVGIEARAASLHVVWQAGDSRSPTESISTSRKNAAAKHAASFLNALGQPASYIRVYMAACAGLAQDNLLPADRAAPTENYNLLQASLREALTYSGGFHRYNPGESPETGLYWLRDDRQAAEPLADQVEKLLVNTLIKNPGITTDAMEAAVCQAFPGLLTPNREQILACLNSYAIESPDSNGCWALRPEDKPAARRTDLDRMLEQLEALGRRLGFQIEGSTPLIWKDGQGIPCFIFFRLVSAVIGPILRTHLPGDSATPVILIPGGRAGLIEDKLRHNPRLAQLVQPWHFLKTRHLRLLYDSSGITAGNFLARIHEDPLTGPQQQMRLL